MRHFVPNELVPSQRVNFRGKLPEPQNMPLPIIFVFLRRYVANHLQVKDSQGESH